MISKKQLSNNRYIKKIVPLFLSLLCSIGIPIIAAICYQLQSVNLLRIMITSIISGCVILLSQILAIIHNTYQYDNEKHLYRFSFVFALCFIIACLFPLFPAIGWPFLFIALLLSIFSNISIGMLSYSSILTLVCTLGNTSINGFYIYFICGIITIILFERLDEHYRIGIPIFLSLCVLLLSSTANIVLFSNETISMETFIIPTINLFCNGIIMLLCLKTFSVLVIHKDRETYLTINDTEYSVLVDLKNENRAAYYRSIHTAYLSDKIAKRLELDVDATKSAGYYHRLWKVRKETFADYFDKLENEYFFPENACKLIKELNKKDGFILSKEGIVVYMSDCIVDSILFVFEKDKSIEIEYDKMISLIFKKKIDKGIFDHCILSISELNEIKKIFMEDTLYYDFLR